MRSKIFLVTFGFAAALFAGDTASIAPTFNHDVAPILYKNCSNCHRPGEVAPFALLTYEDAAKRAKQIAAVTQARFMPPWKAEEGYGHFLNERKLTDQQIATLGEWARNGAPEGTTEKPVPPKFSNGWQGGEPDQVVAMSQAVSLPAEGPDQFRCFVIPLNAKADEYVSQVEFRPGDHRVVHHAILFMDTTGQARKRETVPGQGYDCVGGPGLAIAGGLGGWAPGASPTKLPEGISQTIKQGADLVMQIHYHLSGKPEEDLSSVGITFAKAPPVKGLTLLTLGNTGIDIPAGDNHYVVKASATLPMDAEIIGVTPHAHYLCKDMKVDAKLPDGSVQPLIWIKDWDFNWQGSYRYASPMKLPKGTEIDMQYIYDNSDSNPRNPSNPPKRVTFGEQTTNEMGFTFIQLTLDTPALVPEFQRDANAQFVASLLDGNLDSEEFGPQQTARLKMLLNFFDKNKNGRIDPDERPALIEFLKKQERPK
jgi:mono/diheme cytochrome c family protein